MMKKRIAAVLLTLATVFTAMPVDAFAAEQTVTVEDGGSTCEVTASANVTNQDLEDLGLNMVVSFPVEVVLTLDKPSKVFAGDGNIYVYGIMDEGKNLSVAIDTENEDYGKVKYRKSAGAAVSQIGSNFHASVTEKMVKYSYALAGAEKLDEVLFSSVETMQNCFDRADGGMGSYYAKLTVEMDGLVPGFGRGIYFTNIPFKIAIQ